MELSTYAFVRAILYAWVWAFAVIDLGLTSYSIHHQKRVFHNAYDPDTVALIVASCLTIIWVFALWAMYFLAEYKLRTIVTELVVNLLLWVFWLIPTAIFTHHNALKELEPPGKMGRIARNIEAFSWLIFGFLTIANHLVCMDYAVLAEAEEGAPGYQGREKGPPPPGGQRQAAADTTGNA